MNKSILEINQLVLPINIGVTSEERSIAQAIEFHITIEFHSLPKACISNNIEDAICYAEIVKSIQDFCYAKEFHLIESLCYDTYELLAARTSNAKIRVKICKQPPINEIQGSCCFEIS